MTALSATNRRAHLIGIFIIAFAVLAYQVLLTRLFSVMLYYHFAFAGVSLVMLGLTIGAERVYLDKQRFAPEKLNEEWAKAAVRFAVSSISIVLWFIYIPWVLPHGLALPAVTVSLILFTIPFVYSGICVTLTLTRSSFSIGRLYAADLVGAATGCIGIVALLFLIDPISIFFALAAIISVAACIMAPRGTPTLGRARALAAVFGVACLLQSGLYLTGSNHLRVMWAKGGPQQDIIFERWNALSRIRVVPYDITSGAEDDAQTGKTGKPFGWGFGHPQTQHTDQLFMDIDAQAKTVITRFDGHDLRPFAFLANDIINMAYHVRPMKTVAVIGVGGGRDVMSALYFGVQHVTGIEMNPAIFEVLTKRFAEYAGYFYKRPDVSLVNAEARSWLNQGHQSFDLIQVSLIDTWAATAAGGLTMSENRLYTVDAWKDFLARLHPDGVLEVSRWFGSVGHKAEFYRLLSLAAETLKARGVPADELQSHIMAFSVNQIVTVLVSPSPFTQAEVQQANRSADQEGFSVMIDPSRTWDETSSTIVSGRATNAFYDGLSSDLTAPTDNRPFFFYTWRPFSFLFAKSQVEA